MSKEKYTPWDAAEFLTDDEIIVEYLKAALEEDDPAFFMKAVGNVARAKGMTAAAQDASLGRPSLYKALSGERAGPENRHGDEGACRARYSAHGRAEAGVAGGTRRCRMGFACLSNEHLSAGIMQVTAAIYMERLI